MNVKIELLISGVLTTYVIIGTIRVNLFKRDNSGLMIGLISMISIGFGMYLWVKNGLIMDYGTEEAIVQTNAQLMANFGTVNVLIGLIFIIISIIKFSTWKLKNKRS